MVDINKFKNKMEEFSRRTDELYFRKQNNTKLNCEEHELKSDLLLLSLRVHNDKENKIIIEYSSFTDTYILDEIEKFEFFQSDDEFVLTIDVPGKWFRYALN